MYWKFKHNGVEYYSWGAPRTLEPNEVQDVEADFSVPVYNGAQISPGETVLAMMQGDSTLGLGDAIWLINYYRDIYNIKGRRRCEFYFASGGPMQKFFSRFLPRSFHYIPDYVATEDFIKFNHRLPSMYYWKEEHVSDKSWVDDKSILERLYDWTGMKYVGLNDFGDFTDEELLYPRDDFFERLQIPKNERYVFFQWHSSGHSKNLPPSSNIKIIQHLIKKYGVKVYVIGKLNSLGRIEEIDGVRNLSGKTILDDLIPLAFRSDMIVCPDSAGIHLGEAFRIPTVAIMATLPPSYVAAHYKIPSFMFGSGECRHKPCGIVHQVPRKTRCPEGTGDYCKVLEEIDLQLFDLCVQQTFENRTKYRQKRGVYFYAVQNLPISLR